MKKNLTSVMTLGMVLTMLGVTAAFANEAAEAETTAETAEAVTEPLLIAEDPGQTIEEVIAEAQESRYLTQNGTVTSVEASETEGVSIVTMENEMGGLRFAVASHTIIINREDGFYLTADQLTEGMAVSVVYDMNSPMGMSMPPFLGNVAAVVANADAGAFTVGKFDNELTDMKNMLKLNIDNERTAITTMQGSRIRLTDADVKGKDALVFYDMMTRSLPAQTNPSFVLILEAPVTEEVVTEEVETAVPELVEVSFVPLRDMAEKMGFTVKWQGKANPILLEKDGVSMEVMLGEATYSVNGKAAEAAMKAELIDGVMYVSDEIFA